MRSVAYFQLLYNALKGFYSLYKYSVDMLENRKFLRVMTESVDLVIDYSTDLIFYLSMVIPVKIKIPLCRHWLSNYFKQIFK